MNPLITRVKEIEHAGAIYLGFTTDTTDDQARQVFAQRYKAEALEVIRSKGAVLVGPIVESSEP